MLDVQEQQKYKLVMCDVYEQTTIYSTFANVRWT